MGVGKWIKSKTLSGNPIRIHTRILENGLVYIDKYVYSNKPLQYFKKVNQFPKRFGRTLYRQEIVFSQEVMATLPILSGVYQKIFHPTETE